MLVFCKWPFVGVYIETFGFLNLFERVCHFSWFLIFLLSIYLGVHAGTFPHNIDILAPAVPHWDIFQAAIYQSSASSTLTQHCAPPPGRPVLPATFPGLPSCMPCLPVPALMHAMPACACPRVRTWHSAGHATCAASLGLHDVPAHHLCHTPMPHPDRRPGCIFLHAMCPPIPHAMWAFR